MFSIPFLNALRCVELLAVLDMFPKGGRVLEIGAGTGQQAAHLKSVGFAVAAIDLPNSDYSGHRVFPVLDYSGTTIPFDDSSYDVIYTSNVLEHIPDLSATHREIRRVLRPQGVCIHVVPTHTWRFWTSVAAIPALFQHALAAMRAPTRTNVYKVIQQCGIMLLQPRHGEQGHALTELWTFHPRYWRAHFEKNGFVIQLHQPVGIFYTGEMILGARLGMQHRAALSRWLGSACHVFKLKVKTSSPAERVE
jgi:SAM-dependent methyltransferase